VLLSAWVLAEIVHVIDIAVTAREDGVLPLVLVNYAAVLFRMVVCGLITWRVWKWANQSIESETEAG